MANTSTERARRWRKRNPVRARTANREGQQRFRDAAKEAKRAEVITWPDPPADPAAALCDWTRVKLVIPPGQAACGVSPSLFQANSDGTAQRESWRRFLHGFVQPLARLIETELRAKLEISDVKLSFEALFASDISAKSRSYATLTKAGIDPAEAARLVGLMESDE